MEVSIKSLANALTLKPINDDEDKFAEVMSGFLEEAQSQYSVLSAMRQKLDSLYKELSEYFVFDKIEYTLEDFFGDISLKWPIRNLEKIEKLK